MVEGVEGHKIMTPEEPTEPIQSFTIYFINFINSVSLTPLIRNKTSENQTLSEISVRLRNCA